MYFKSFPNFLYDFEMSSKVSDGNQAEGKSTLIGDVVAAIFMSDIGSGYLDAQVTFQEPPNGLGGTRTTGTAIIKNGAITGVTLTNPGSGYVLPPKVTFSVPFGKTESRRVAYVVTDITQNVRVRKELLQNITLYEEYDIVDGETPEIIAEKIYGDAYYHWVVMLTNNKFDYRNDFPLDYPRLTSYITEKYGDDSDAVHHWESDKGYVVVSDYPGAVSVSNRQHEELLNEKKRRIKIIDPSLLNLVLKNFEDLI